MARFTRGKSGNPAGKPKGTTDWRSKLRKQIEDAAPDLIDRLIAEAEGGDVSAIKLLLDKVLPNIKPQSLPVTLPISAGDDAGRAEAVLSAMMQGQLSPDQGGELIAAIRALCQIKEVSDLEQRITALEEKTNERKDLGNSD